MRFLSRAAIEPSCRKPADKRMQRTLRPSAVDGSSSVRASAFIGRRTTRDISAEALLQGLGSNESRAHTLPDAIASQRVLMKCGFEGVGETFDADDGLVARFERNVGG